VSDFIGTLVDDETAEEARTTLGLAEVKPRAFNASQGQDGQGSGWYKLGQISGSQQTSVSLFLIGNTQKGPFYPGCLGVISFYLADDSNPSYANCHGDYYAIGNPFCASVKCKQVGSDRFKYEIHFQNVYVDARWSVLAFVHDGTWEHGFAASSDPGSNGPTVYAFTSVFRIQHNCTLGPLTASSLSLSSDASFVGQTWKLQTAYLGSDGTKEGLCIPLTVDSNSVGVGGLLYMKSNGNLAEADADSATTVPGVFLAVDSGTGSNKRMLVKGIFRLNSWSWTPGQILYASPTAGGITATRPSTTGQQVQVVGIALTSNIIFFDPQLVIVEI